MLARVSWRSVLVAIVCVQSGCAFFGIVPDEGKDDDECLDGEAKLVGQWISPQGSTTASPDYQLTTFTAGGGLGIEHWQGGTPTSIQFQAWRVSSTDTGTCDQIEMDLDGSGWLAQVWKIHELTGTVLDIEATDGTYVGPHTRYDWWNGGVATCGEICDPVDSHCAVGELCLNSTEGYQCLPESCQSCFDGGQSCSWYVDSCAFDTCV